MYNDFVLINPESDPAGVKGADILTALKTIRTRRRAFGKTQASISGLTRGLPTRKFRL
jgi:ABC-type tungstate transport system permease subunit